VEHCIALELGGSAVGDTPRKTQLQLHDPIHVGGKPFIRAMKYGVIGFIWLLSLGSHLPSLPKRMAGFSLTISTKNGGC
jgi:hypothetical protein